MKTKMLLTSLFSILISVMSWVMNFGFIRFFCTAMLIPFVHAVIIFAFCVVAVSNLEYRKIRLYNFLFTITYLIGNIFLPDVDEVGNIMFFGLIHNDILCNFGWVISTIALMVHLILLVLQVIEIILIKTN